MTYLSHNASFHSRENTTPSNPGTKHLGGTVGDDEFVFHFDTPRGIDAQRLGVFLQRAAKVARDNGANLRIVAIEEGSLDVVARVTKATARKVGGEFAANPVKTMAASSILVGVVIKGVAMVMALSESEATPLAKAGAEKEPVQNITTLWQGGQVIVIDPVSAGEVLYPGAHFRVRDELILRHNRPYALIVSSATRI